eukprot:CAMPEP_0179033920 /NCGR_PEP_ID=MMETSP0796-20121207/12345_1 /TAXON_ID=73915 /ORGANISM="Pyrodinium bahamense, Strain pbaha01" /LENGTH=57 /DNA_ID=CAMNT_0020730179 /DNA_START=1 /DNA_END=171 /DNA_ORIENTATION=+
MIVRNPYSRILSGYLDKIVHARKGEAYDSRAAKGNLRAGFADFVVNVTQRRGRAATD